MKNGNLIEIGPTKEVLTKPKGIYTRSLVSSVPPTNKKISRFDENVLVYQPSLNILSSLIKYEKQKKKIEDFNVQSIWDNKYLKYNDFKKLHSFYWLFSIDLKSSNQITQTIIKNWIKKKVP